MLSPAVTISFVTSTRPLNDLQPKPWVKKGLQHGYPTRSAGTNEHLLVPHAASAAVFEYFERALANAASPDEGG